MNRILIGGYCSRGSLVKHTTLLCRTSSTATVGYVDGVSGSGDIKPFSDIPGPKGLYDIPFIGTALHFKPFTKYKPNDLLDVLSDMRDKHGDIVKVRMGKYHVVFVYHPDYAKAVFQLPFKEHTRVGLDLNDIFHERTGIPKDLAMLQGEKWAALRKPTQEKMLRPAVVASYVPLIEQVTIDFIDMLRTKKTVDDLLKELMNYTTERRNWRIEENHRRKISGVGMLCFNTRLGCFESNTSAEISKHVKEFFSTFQSSITMPFKTYKHFRTKLYKRFEQASLEILRITGGYISAQINHLMNLEKEGKLEEYLEKEPNFMYSLLTDPRMTESKVKGIVNSLFLAGVDSTANSMVFVLTNLALNPDKQDKLCKEIQRVVGDSKSLTKDHLNELSYLKCCIKESQRFVFPVLIGAPRLLETDIVLGGYRIPNKTLVHPNMSAMSRDERFYPRPNEYIPERWLRSTTDDISKSQDFPFGMKPFGFGPRGCIGQRFAEMEMYIAIAKIIQNFAVVMPESVTEVKSMSKTFTTPAETVIMHFKERNKQS